MGRALAKAGAFCFVTSLRRNLFTVDGDEPLIQRAEVVMPGEEFEATCSVCGRKKPFDDAVEAGWFPNYVDRAGVDRDVVCDTCIEALGLVMNKGGEMVFPDCLEAGDEG